ncbi:MAG: Uncharacterized protein JWM85_209 [Acidimicrobiaceae bacterium]|nr:Uncharacterized protein [Acidimicrobiaceae bacterium]
MFAGVAFGIWMLTLSTIDNQDIVVAAPCALACGALAAGGRWAIGGSWPLDPGFLRPLWRLPFVVASDTVQVLVSPLRARNREGEFSTFRVDAAGLAPRSAARRAATVLAISFPPGSYVLDIDASDGTVLLHRLARRGPRLEDHVAS